MYEENLTALPQGDFSTIFADVLADVQRATRPGPPERILAGNVIRWANTDIQPHFARICRRLLLPGSGIFGIVHLAEAARLADEGHSCIICLNHRSNLDVPTLCALLEDQGNEQLFQRVIWIAGRKLHEDVGATPMLVQAFNQVIVSPRSWLKDGHSYAELWKAHLINIAAHRAIRKLRHQGWMFALFPAATRLRPRDPSTAQAIEETDSYLKHFEFMLLCRIEGCTLPVSREQDLTHETPTLDRMRYVFAAVQRTDAWREQAKRRFAECNRRAASAKAIVEDIAAIRSAATP